MREVKNLLTSHYNTIDFQKKYDKKQQKLPKQKHYYKIAINMCSVLCLG